MRLRKDLADLKLASSRPLDLCPYCGHDPGADGDVTGYGCTRFTKCEVTRPGEDGAVICRCPRCQKFWVEGYRRRADNRWPPETVRVDAHDPQRGRIVR